MLLHTKVPNFNKIHGVVSYVKRINGQKSRYDLSILLSLYTLRVKKA